MLEGSAKIKYLTAVLMITALTSCRASLNTSDREKLPLQPKVEEPTVAWDGRGIDQFSPTVQGSGDASSLAMALSDCDCASKSVAALMFANATQRGVLPQVLVPQVRESIASDPKLQILAKLPTGLGSALKNWFVTDDKIATEIRSTVSKQLSQSLSSVGGTSLATRVPFRMDLFTPLAGQTTSFDVADQAVNWNVVMGRKSAWVGGTPVDGIDHGLQVLATLKIAAEWAYMAGIGSGGKPNGFGGLALDVRSGNTQLSKPFDPAEAPKGAGLFATGGFTIAYPSAASVDLATKVKENWSFRTDNVALLTQARIWRAAALGFQNLRMDRAKNTRAILSAKDGAMSPDIQQIPLIWLPGMAELLEQKFINKDTRFIRQYGFGVDGAADLETLITLADALQQWRIATTSIQTSNLSANLMNQLKDVPEKLLQPMQLVVQTIISQYTFVQSGNDKKILVGSNGKALDARIAAKVIYLLASLEQTTLQSQELKAKVKSLMASHAPAWTSGAVTSDAATMIEQYKAASAMAKYSDAQPWVTQLRDKLGAAVVSWGGL